jgi:kynurenine formamidase
MTEYPHPTPDWRELGKSLSNWGRWGADDQRGTINLIGADEVRAAAALVKKGKIFDLGIPLDEHGPQDGRERFNPVRLMSVIGGAESIGGSIRYNDDCVFMSLQAGTQWDALSHVYYDDRYYNDVPKEAVDAKGAHRLGIETQGNGIVGRGILVDIARQQGLDWLGAGAAIGPELLEQVIQEQGVAIREGDILLIRTGWRRKYLEDHDGKAFLGSEPGIALNCCAWLKERGVAAIASDNWALEVIPSEVPGEAFPLHMLLIRDMGMTIGEMFDLEDLALGCSQDQIYEFYLCAPVLKFTNGVGTPINPLAIK